MKNTIYNIENYSFDNIEIKNPKKTTDNYQSKINFCFQTPILEILKTNEQSITLGLTDSVKKLLDNFDNYIINNISEKSETFFDDKITPDELEDIYKSSYFKDKFILKFSDSLNIYTNSNSNLEKTELKENLNVIALVKCSKIIYYKTFCLPYWEVIQIKIKEKKTEKVKIDRSSYLFVDNENSESETESDDDKKIKKINFKK